MEGVVVVSTFIKMVLWPYSLVSLKDAVAMTASFVSSVVAAKRWKSRAEKYQMQPHRSPFSLLVLSSSNTEDAKINIIMKLNF